jgi:alpha-L-fucosidase
MKKPLIFFLMLCCIAVLRVQQYKPTAQNLANRAWFQDAKLGLFVHWGVYTTGMPDIVFEISQASI